MVIRTVINKVSLKKLSKELKMTVIKISTSNMSLQKVKGILKRLNFLLHSSF